MDMHELEFDDERFDVVISGWTLPYSTDPKRALSEKERVLRPAGLLCIALTRVPPNFDEVSSLESQGAANYLSSQQVLTNIDGGVVRVEFRNDPFDRSSKGAVLLIVHEAR